MKKTFFGLIAFLITTVVFAQAPQSINYQAVLRNSSGTVISGQIVNLRFNIIDETATTVYSEDFTGYSINTYGVINVKIGTGTPTIGSFSLLDWRNNNYSIQVEADAGSGFEQFTAEEFSSVPYALNTAPEYWTKNGYNLYYVDSASASHNTITVNRPIAISSSDDMLELKAPASPSNETFQFIEMQHGTTVKARIGGDGSAEFKNVKVSQNISDSTTTAPVAGILYRDNLPLAWGYVSSSTPPTFNSSFGVADVTYNTTTFTYTVTLDNSWVNYATIIVTPITAGGNAEVPGITQTSNSNTFNVKIYDAANPTVAHGSDFMFTVFARPQ